MSKWFYFNFLLFSYAIWKVAIGSLLPHIIFGALGFVFIMSNWTRHAVFSTLRSSIPRQKKIKFAKLSKKMMPYHRWIGTTAFILIIIHAILVIRLFGFNLSHPKILVGLLTGLVLFLMVLIGWMNFFRPTVRKRKIHLRLGITMFFMIILHLVL